MIDKVKHLKEIIAWLENQNALKLSDEILDPPTPMDLEEIEYLRVDTGYLNKSISNLSDVDLGFSQLEACRNSVGKKIVVSNSLEVYAWYQPIHYYGEHWGIYIKDSGVNAFMQSISSFLTKLENQNALHIINQIQKIAIEILRLHEEYHHIVEAFAIKQHLITLNPTYIDYNDKVYFPSKSLTPCPCPEERLCDAYVYRKLQSKIRGRVSKELFDATLSSLRAHMASASGPYQGSLSITSSKEFKKEQKSNLTQVLTAETHPNIEIERTKFLSEALKPFSSLNQNVYLVRDVDMVNHVPGVHLFAAPRRKVEKYILKRGYLPTNEGDGSHTKYKKDGAPFIVLTKGREQSQTVLKSTAKALGMDLQDFLKEVRSI